MYGNEHDFDYVLERGGTPEKIGTPLAFIEIAWRRYTRHSKNKAQEIQGAIRPLIETFHEYAPAAGVVLAGEFTAGAINQLKSLGFSVLYFRMKTIVKAFAGVGVDAKFDEDTSDEELKNRVEKIEELSKANRNTVVKKLISLNQKQVDSFLYTLERHVTRHIDWVRILPLYGNSVEYASVEEAISFVQDYHEAEQNVPLVKYEIEVRYSNGDRVSGQFHEKQAAMRSLKRFLE
ncbi:hypothetical protein ES703_85971 [subsurface metagenome]